MTGRSFELLAVVVINRIAVSRIAFARRLPTDQFLMSRGVCHQTSKKIKKILRILASICNASRDLRKVEESDRP